MAHTVQHAKFVQKLVREFNVAEKPNMQIWCDKAAAVQMMKNGTGTKRKLFGDIRHHYIQ